MSSPKQTAGRLPAYDDKTHGWTRRDATHLLWRAGFGATFDEIDRASKAGLKATLDRLLTPQQEPAEFESTQQLLLRTALDTRNIADLKAWWLYRMLYSANPLVEKMSLLWHNQFATSNAKVQSVQHMADQNHLIRQHAVGSFRKLLHGMSHDVAMLIWLDGNANRKRHANENFAREVMELFSLGVGNYTEQDIKQAARAFTGWHVRGGKFWFNRGQHDFGNKQLLGRSGKLDGNDVIDICLQQPACPRFLAAKLLRLFVTPTPDAKLTQQVAGRIRAHDFQMTPVLRELFGSELFFSEAVRHSVIKSPIDLVLGAHRALDSEPNLQTTGRLLADLGQDVFQPPTVKGWEGDRLWINSATLLQRANFAAEVTKGDRLGAIADPVSLAQKYSWNSHEAVIRHYCQLLLARDVEADVVDKLTRYLRQAKGDRNRQIRSVIHLIMTMPEYQLL